MARRRFFSRLDLVGAFLLGCCLASVGIGFFHFSAMDELHNVVSTSDAHHPSVVAKVHSETAKEHHAVNVKKQKLAANHKNLVHPVAGLDCKEHDGPMEQDATDEMVYWRDIPQDNNWVSPFKNIKNTSQRQYLTFEPDGGGWNNIRMSMETVLTMALAMGRVLVLPPSQKMYLLGHTTFNFADFFPLQELAEEHAGLEIITTEQFLIETMGTTVDQQTHEISFPPEESKTSWDGDTRGIKSKLAPWIRSIANSQPDWDPSTCIAAFPKSKDPKDAQQLQQEFDEILKEKDGLYASRNAYKEFINNPTPVDASSKDRLRELTAERSKLCIYDETLQESQIIHFHGKAKTDTGGRLLVHFYAFLFFQDYQTDLWMKRFVRDHVRYVDNIQCAAARIVHKLRTTTTTTLTEYDSQDNNNNNNNNNGSRGGKFDSFHIRRGDFQYKATRVDAQTIVERAQDVIPKGRVVYIGTDERDKTFFRPLQDAGWKILFLDDFMDVVGTTIDPHYYGMIDQLVVSRGENMFGCWFSTFSSYIMRLRGYHSQREISDWNPDSMAFLDGKLPHSYYYALEDSKTKMHDYWAVKKVFYAREFPAAWRNLDV